MESRKPMTEEERRVEFFGIWQTAVHYACLASWLMTDDNELRVLLSDHWQKCVHRLTLIQGACSCQKGEPQYCLLRVSPRLLDRVVVEQMGTGVCFTSFCESVMAYRESLEQILAIDDQKIPRAN